MPAIVGDLVRVRYTAALDDGTVFDSTDMHGRPMEFRLGDGTVVPGFESAVLGLDVGDSRSMRVLAEHAYGPHNPDLIRRMTADSFEVVPELGARIDMATPDGQIQMQAIVTDVQGDDITLDLNHPLAGMDLVYDVTLEAIVSQAS